MKPIGIIGSSGNMASRYIAILNKLGIDYVPFDEKDWRDATRFVKDLHSVIICSPTEHHYENVMVLKDFKILCEKPFSLEMDKVIEMTDAVKNLRMVNQYDYLIPEVSKGTSHYNYFKSGGDGLAWDCINIIGLADAPATISNKSPLWDCQINGYKLSLSDMDRAYCKMIVDWTRRTTSNKRYTIEAHRKVIEGHYRYD